MSASEQRLHSLTKQDLQNIVAETRHLLGQGKVADYIPALGNVNPDKIGLAVYCKEHGLIGAGDYQECFSIQSISKVLSLTLALLTYQNEADIWQRVGKEPSGNSFNSLIQLEMEQGIPRNPFINAGAIVVADMLRSRLASPRQQMLNFVKKLSHNDKVVFDKEVARSEFDHSARNAAIAYLMKSFGNFDNDVMQVLDNYFHYCSISMSCEDLAKTFFYLANQGNSLSGEPILSPELTKKLNALLITSGLYDGAGEFAYRIGMPGKSGVGGGIVAILPRQMSIAVWSPELDSQGNSIIGAAMLELLAKRLQHSVF